MSTATAAFGCTIKTLQATVTGSAAVVTAVPTSPRAGVGVTIKALAANSQIVYVGGTSSVSSSTGYPLSAGDSITLPIDDPSRVWAISASGSQTLALVYV